MRSCLLLSALLFILNSCQIYDRYPSQEATLTAIHFDPSEKPVEVFFIEESKPDRDYIRIAIVEENIIANTSQANLLLKSLQKQSQALGADALLVMKQESIERNSDVTHVPRERMTGIAIRYIDNIRVDEYQLSHLEIISHLDESTEEVQVNGSNEISGNFKTRPAFVAYHYSLHYLLESTQNWKFSKVPVTGGNTLYRRQVENAKVVTSLKTTQYKNGEYDEIKISRLNKLGRNIKMQLDYNGQDQVEKRTWVASNLLDKYPGTFEVLHSYDAKNRLTQEKYYYQFLEDSSSEPFVTINYHYYSPEDIYKILENEQVVRVSK